MNSHIRTCLPVLLFCLVAPLLCAQKPYYAPAEQDVREHIEQWQDLKFGMFIHWGTYSQLGVVESWSICPELKSWQLNSRPKGMNYMDYLKYYENLRYTFNPIFFDPDKWAEAAEYAGMKYVVFTTKHHDGFNMYDTALSDYKITDPSCPFSKNPKADVSKAVFDSFRARGIKAGAYLSIADWHNDDYWWRFLPPKDRYINYDPAAFPEKMAGFEDFVAGQVDELTSGRYGDLELIWFDLTEISESYEIPFSWERIAATARKNQPGIITVARGTNSIYENYLSAEQKIPEKVWTCPWESCMTMSQSWSWRKDPKYKPTGDLLEMLVQVVSRGGNLLLNVGPSALGTLDDEAYDRLREIGDWMKVNSEGIYGTRPIEPYQLGDKLYFTQKQGRIYAFCIAEENGSLPSEVTLPGFRNVSSVRMLGDGRPLRMKRNNEGLYVTIPERLRKSAPCKHICCLVLE